MQGAYPCFLHCILKEKRWGREEGKGGVHRHKEKTGNELRKRVWLSPTRSNYEGDERDVENEGETCCSFPRKGEGGEEEREKEEGWGWREEERG